jgi:hypothetical protein
MNSKVSKRFKKKMKNFRQGMTAWRVIGYPIRDENYHSWGKDQEYLDRNYGPGNATCFNDGSGWYFIYCEKHCNVPLKTAWGSVHWRNGKRMTHEFKSFSSMYGSHGNRVFKKQSQAQAYMMETIKGSHNPVLSESRCYHSELDRLDSILDDMRNNFDYEENFY